MQLTNKQLRQIIKEELDGINEDEEYFQMTGDAPLDTNPQVNVPFDRIAELEKKVTQMAQTMKYFGINKFAKDGAIPMATKRQINQLRQEFELLRDFVYKLAKESGDMPDFTKSPKA